MTGVKKNRFKSIIAVLLAVCVSLFDSCIKEPEVDIQLSLNMTELTMSIGDTAQLKAFISYYRNSDIKTWDQSIIWQSSNPWVASVSSKGLVTAHNGGSTSIILTTGSKTATCEVTVASNKQTISGREYVEMGDGLKWATMNDGATKQEEYGDYFAWGETSMKSNYDWSTYKYGTSPTSLTKYVTHSQYGTVDNKTILHAGDDAAAVIWGGSWRMPTYEEWTWLLTNCTWTCSRNYKGVAGYIVTSNVFGYAGNTIFLPAAGYQYKTSSIGSGSKGAYWSSSLDPSNSSWASSGTFNLSSITVDGHISERYQGKSVRPVSD